MFFRAFLAMEVQTKVINNFRALDIAFLPHAASFASVWDIQLMWRAGMDISLITLVVLFFFSSRLGFSTGVWDGLFVSRDTCSRHIRHA